MMLPKLVTSKMSITLTVAVMLSSMLWRLRQVERTSGGIAHASLPGASMPHPYLLSLPIPFIVSSAQDDDDSASRNAMPL
jgi:hypothetical protein